MVKVPWDELARKSPKASESLVTMLMLRLRERAHAVDGTGGDGGRDLFEYTEDGELVIYEAKSFTGRMASGRRAQVVRSLVSAARHQPDHWDLLVPIDANPGEQRWFGGLREQFPFVRRWLGLSWLDQQFAAHPDLVRYALQESGDYILERIAEARAERDVLLGGIPDLFERYRTLQARAQEISPHYAVHTSVDAEGQATVQLVPKGPDPSGQAAVRFTGRVRFRADDPHEVERQRRFEETMRFGGEVELEADDLAETTVTAPEELGLGPFIPSGMRITSPRQELTPPVRALLAVQEASGVPVASLPVEFTHRITGLDGGTLYGGDLTGFLRMRMRYDQRNESWQLTFSFDPPKRALPQASVPVLRLISQTRPGRFLELALTGDFSGRFHAPVSIGMTPHSWEPDEAQVWADAFDDLARLQSRTGQFFPVPEDFTRRDAAEVREVLALLDGEKVTLKGGTVSVGVINEEALNQLAASPGSMFRLSAGYESMVFTIGEHRIDLGPCVETYTMDKILNMQEARRELAETGHATVRLCVAAHVPAQRYLGTELPR